MKKTKLAPSKITAPSIDDIDAANTPSLVGFWKCDDSGNQILDYSGNDHHLTVTNTNLGSPQDSFDSVEEAQSFKDGWFSMVKGTKAEVVAIGTGLDTGSNFVVAHAEFYVNGTFNSFWDFDCGTAHDFEETDDTYQGFTLAGAVAQGVWCRVAAGKGALDDTTIQTVVGFTDISLAGGFKPSTSVLGSSDENGLDTTVSAKASLTAQDGKFGLGPSSSQVRVSVRNYQLWSFSSEPVYMDETIEWLAHNPGKIPPWWVGR